MKTVCNRLLVALFVVLLAGAASANTLDTSFNFIIGTGDFNNGGGPFATCSVYGSTCSASDAQSVTGNYNLFDTTLGTLTGVTINLTSTFPLGTELLDLGGNASVTGSSDYNVGNIFSGTINAVGYTCTDFCDLYPPNGTIDNTLNATYAVPLADLANYLGTGTANMTIDQSVTVNGQGDQGYIVRARTNQLFTQGWRGTVDIQYNYTAAVTTVPEPSSATMMFGGLAMLVGFVRRKL